MNALDPDNAGIKQGADSLVLDHGYYNWQNVDDFRAEKYAPLHKKYLARLE